MQIFKIFRVYNFPKNLLIILPIIVSGEFQILQDYKKIIIDLFTLLLITSLIYLINDFTDQKRDKINKIKKNNFFLSKKQFFFHLFFIIFFSIIYLYFTETYKNYSIYLYLLNFFLYNFFFKFIKYLDILFLINFYFIRIVYGCISYDLELSFGFIIFIYSLFYILSIYKRKIQIEINQIKIRSKIIAYTMRDIVFINRSILFALIINLFIFFLFFINTFIDNVYLNSIFLVSDLSLLNRVLFIIMYLINFGRLFYSFSKNLIRIDIYIYFLKDMYFRLSLIVLFVGISI